MGSPFHSGILAKQSPEFLERSVMRSLLIVLLVGMFLLLGCQPGEEPTPSAPPEEPSGPAPGSEDRTTVEAAIGAATISINYGRPELRGRDMLAQLGDGAVWRLGMNEATTMESSRALKFGHATVQSGKYSLFAMKASADEWHLVVNSESDIWGTARKPENDVAHVVLQKSDLPESVERFTIEIDAAGDAGGSILIKWSTLQLKADFTIG